MLTRTNLLLGVSGLVFSALTVSTAVAEPAGSTVTRDRSETIDEITVTAPRLKRLQLPSVEFVIETYNTRRRGAVLYNKRQYAEAFPHLLASARGGFKMAQARVGHLYMAGLGTKKDVETGIVWLSLASKGSSSPEIRQRVREIWDNVPDRYAEDIRDRIDEFEAAYSARVNRVRCDFSKSTRSRVKKLSCRYMDQCRYWSSAGTAELMDCPQWFDADINMELDQSFIPH